MYFSQINLTLLCPLLFLPAVEAVSLVWSPLNNQCVIIMKLRSLVFFSLM